MKGWLIINSFLITEKFTDIYDLLVYSAEKKGIDLIPVKSSEVRYYPCLPDFAMLWDKDFYLAEALELRGLRLFNNAKSSGICDDKAKTAILLNSKGIPHPKTVIAPKTYPAAGYNDLSFAEKAAEDLDRRVLHPLLAEDPADESVDGVRFCLSHITAPYVE